MLLVRSHLSPLLCDGKADAALPDFMSGHSDANIEDTVIDIEDTTIDDAASRPTTLVVSPEVENGTVFAPLQIRRLARNGHVDDQNIADYASEVDDTESESDCGLVESSDAELDDGGTDGGA